ncbi:MAG: hypothetical protein IKH16_09765, partial [Selenomonadaceae bacterium]|nr:hypothetical protein [Selenomonadaceae bacterium]
LFARKDLGMPDEVWLPLRDKCWVQNEWSASITPKGAFFCEIAAALDMLFDGPGGWKVEPGWWKRTPEEFGDQLHWCEMCGFALDTFMRDAKEEQDDVSPTLYEKLKAIGSPRLKAGRTNLVKIVNGEIAEESKAHGKHFSAAQPYIEHYEDRFNEENSVLYVDGYKKIRLESGENFGIELNRELDGVSGWVLLCFREDVDENVLREFLHRHVLNPGTLHLSEDFALFCPQAFSMRCFGYDRIAHVKSFDEIIDMWQSEKVVHLKNTSDGIKQRRASILPDQRYALWGAGLSGGFIADEIQMSDARLVFVVDVDENKHGKDFYGATIYEPKYLMEHIEEFDFLAIGHYTKFQEIKQEAIAMGIPSEKILLPHEL